MEDFDEYMYDDDGNPIRCPEFEREENPFEGVEDNKDIFHVKGDGYDVTLSLASGRITWKNVNPTGIEQSYACTLSAFWHVVIVMGGRFVAQ